MASRRVSRIKPHLYRENTKLEIAVDEAWEDAEGFVSKMPNEEKKDDLTFLPQIQNAAFCGHLMADLDSIAGAIGAAYLYNGVATRASDINSETKWALKKWGCEEPGTIEDMMTENPDCRVCLVDFQQQSQLNKAIPMKNIVGVIDHHALQNNTIVTEIPVFIDIRPWGCMSSILAHSFAVQEKFLPKNIAGMLLSAILSDTLNLKSPTCTKWDERMVSMLVQYLDIDDVNVIAAEQFRAKSHELSLMTPYQLVNGDTKKFKFSDAVDPNKIYSVAYGVIETTDAASSIARIGELIPEMKATRDEDDLVAMFLAVVDIVNLTSMLIIAGKAESSLALKAYGGELEEGGKMLPLKGLVSRKKDFIPSITRAFEQGWTPPSLRERKLRRESSIVVMDYTDFAPGKLTRVFTINDINEDDDDEENEQ